MKCINCNIFSLTYICKSCQKTFLIPNISKRVLSDGLIVYSFYKYSEVGRFLKRKHYHDGYHIYKILAKNSFKEFSRSFEFKTKVYALSIDDKLTPDYSHTAILSKELKSRYIKPIFNSLRAKNSVSYSTKSLEFRLKNPRDFQYNYKENIDVILVDDIITTGTTLSEAKQTLKKYGVNVLFALTLADARE